MVAALNNVAMAVRAQMDLLNERLPRKIETQRTSQLATPSSGGQSSSSHLSPVEELMDTAWPFYETKPVGKDYYFDLLLPHFEKVNRGERFRLTKSKSHFWVKDEGEKKTLLRCARDCHHGRNLYLELHAHGYDVLAWKEARAEMSLEFAKLGTPPSYR